MHGRPAAMRPTRAAKNLFSFLLLINFDLGLWGLLDSSSPSSWEVVGRFSFGAQELFPHPSVPLVLIRLPLVA